MTEIWIWHSKNLSITKNSNFGERTLPPQSKNDKKSCHYDNRIHQKRGIFCHAQE